MFLEDSNDDFNLAADAELTQEETDLLTEAAQALGLLVTTEEADALTRILDRQDEALTEDAKNIVRLNKKAKLDSLTTITAIAIARRKNDPEYAKYAKFSQLKRQFRDRLTRKYGNSARSTARQILANGPKKNMVDVSTTAAFGNPGSRV